ncbi:MAG TPA: 50S ribosomal protein L21e [Candidatus Bathyarchaeia archaeon]|nr:50S ribosomal protein L21e [Candidatus Bathyarchaeia archaeon]
MKPSKGYCAGTRSLMKKAPRDKGKPKLTKFLYQYELGASVIIKIDSSQQKSLPHRRFHGKIGKVIAKRGRGYVVSVAQGNSMRKIITRTEHLEPYKGS